MNEKIHYFLSLIFISLISSISFMYAETECLTNNNAVKKALIFGITGQDGAFLAEFLLEKNYEVHGIKRQSSIKNTDRIDTLLKMNDSSNPHFFIHFGDVGDSISVNNLINTIRPDEVYNLAAQSHVKVSFEVPAYSIDINGMGVLRILEAIRLLRDEKSIKFYQASTSEMFGKVHEIPQTESTPFHPRSPYGVAKLLGHWISIHYREAYGLFTCNGILFNHESPSREETFVTRKITLAACRYKHNLQDILYIGNLDAKRDWGYAKDYVEAMWLMVQQNTPEDFVIATGVSHSVREFIELAYQYVGVNIEWHGTGDHEYGIDTKTGKIIVAVNPEFYRPSEVDFILGNAEKAKKLLNWEAKTTFSELLQIMMESDLKKISKEAKENYEKKSTIHPTFNELHSD